MKRNIISISLRLIWLITGIFVTVFGIYIFLSIPKNYVKASSVEIWGHKPIWEGYTSSATTGNFDGVNGANTLCQAAYPGSHWASAEELVGLGSSYPWTYDVWLGNVFSGPMNLGSKYVIGVFKTVSSVARGEHVAYLNLTTCTGYTSDSQTFSMSGTVSGYNNSGYYRGDYYSANYYSTNYQYGSVMRAAGYPDWATCDSSYRLACVK